MIYKFYIVSDEVDNFKRVISIDSDDTFIHLRNAILDSIGYSKDQMDSFFICDDDWSKEKEITLTDMGSDSDEDIWLMDDTHISDLVEDEGQKLLYVFDYLTDRSLFMEMKKTILGKNLKEPICDLSIGEAAPQFLESAPDVATTAKTTNDFDPEFYGDETYNEDELDADGYNDMNMDPNS